MAKSAIHYRKCTELDLELLTQVAKETFTEAFVQDNSRFNFNEYISQAFSKVQISKELRNQESEFYFALSGNDLIGYFKVNTGSTQTDLVDQNGMELERIYVLPKFQNLGLGQKLLAQAIEIARAKLCPFIWLGVWEKNTSAIRFYRRHRFVHSGYHPFKLGDEDQTDFIMKLELSGKG